ncbi:MAG: Flp pilus assembly protein CpaB [Deltaproteobacteria bacterium]|nr:Flp pilus assembly protein CpaB [Deltaproteobacteria bacterium]
MERKQKNLITIVLFGVLALILNRWYLESERRDMQPTEFERVAVAKKAIKAGTPLRPEDYAVRKIPKQYKPQLAISEKDIERFRGQALEVGVQADDYILASYFSDIEMQGETLSKQLSPSSGERAITIPVDQTNSLARSIVRGDKIDILLTFTPPRSSQKVSIVLLPNVTVIATGTYAASDREVTMEEKVRYSTLTLKLSARDAMRLNYAQQVGSIQVLLRNNSDNQIASLPAIAGVIDLLTVEERAQVEKASKESLPNEEAFKQQLNQLFEQQRQQHKD